MMGVTFMNFAMPALALLAGYLLGSIPFGLLLTRLTGAGDLRAIGSGNIGATNVLRTGRKGLAAATLLLDLAKGAGAVLLLSITERWVLVDRSGVAGDAERAHHARLTAPPVRRAPPT